MNELIKVTTNEQGSKVVSAKELYDFLGYNPTQWSRWYKKNIKENTFAFEGQDWQGLDIMSNGNLTQDFAITIDFAKRLAMMARTEKGEEIRDYFIACEKKLRELVPVNQLPQSYSEALRQLAEQVEEKERLEAENKILAPKAEYTDKVLKSADSFTTTTIAKEIGMSAVELNRKLCEKGVQYNHDGHYVLYSKYQNKGYTETRTHQYFSRKDGSSHTTHLTVWTERGRAFIHHLFNGGLSYSQPSRALPAAPI